MSMDMNASASASVSADGSASAGASASASGGIGGSLAGALGGSVGAGLAVAGGLALSAAASFSANLSFSAGASASFGASMATPGVHPPDIYPVFKFIVEIEGMGPVRFQGLGPIKATPQPAQSSPPATQSQSAGHTPPAGGNTPPAAHGGATAASTTHVAQGGAGGSTVMLPPGAWKWDDLTLKRGLAKDGTALMVWIMKWMKGNYQDKRGVTVIMLDLEGKPGMTWNFKKTFPKEWSIPAFDAGTNALVIETLKLGHDGADLILS